MSWSTPALLRREDRTRQRRAALACESLEGRVVLNATAASHLTASASHAAIHKDQAPVIGIITGAVTKNSSTRVLKNVKIQLIDPNGNVVETTRTNAKGNYKLKIFTPGPYVVRQVAPLGFIQTSPTFTDVPPSGALNPPPNSWSYSTGNNNPANGPVGPYAWDTIAPAGDLPFQSPVNITGGPIDLSTVLSVNYNNSTPTDITNNGHQFQVQYPTNNPSDTITVNGTVFDLAQFHYHDPSEHTVNGLGYPMEEHFVNTSASGAETVVGVFIQLGAHNNALDPILNAASTLSAANSKTTLSTVDFAGLLPSSTQGWFYEGSLTTPPLSQTVNWFVFSTPITMDFGQLQKYEAAAKAGGFLPNARPQQALDGRQLNEIDFQVNFQNQFTARLNFNDEQLLRA
jgi:carbonic anhydrase